ncbi:MAG: hypothetical protein ACYDH4_09905, partial [Candidatus Cryosericum sp.]
MDYDNMSHEARELILFIENTEPLYRQDQYIAGSLNKKVKRGVFDREKAAKAYEYLADRAAKEYAKENATPREWNRIFVPETRREAARFLRDAYVEEHAPKYS